MNVAENMVAIGYEFGANHDADWGGFCRDLDEARQECQAIADGPLSWQEDIPGEWEAVDPDTGAVFEISAREY